MRRRQAPNRPRRVSPSPLDARAQEVIARVVHVLARCGCTPEQICEEVLKACRRVPKSWRQPTKAETSEIEAAAHVLTLWFQDPGYLDSTGNPKPLSLRDGERSLEALVRRVDPDLDVERILGYLLRYSVLRRIGSRYLPRDRALMLHSGAAHHARSLQTMGAMLSTLEHNNRTRDSTLGWFERAAVNARVPASARANFDEWLHREGTRMLERIDAKLHGYEQKRRKGERTVHMGAGIYRIGEEALPPKRRTRRRIPRRK
jgi:hypothetical protein